MELNPTKSPTRQQLKIIDAAERIRTGPPPDENSITYMARPLVQATLPHSDPGDVPVWSRINGDLSHRSPLHAYRMNWYR